MQIPGYRTIRRINHGGMSTVYLAVQLSVGRDVALKIMSPVLNADPIFGRRFQREANIVGQLSHPNIVSIYDIGRHNSLNYIAMDYLPGGTVHERMQAGMSTADVLQVMRQMAQALDHVHSKGYVHRDIKPENILFREDSTAILTDFGVAKSLTASSRASDTGTIVGTPHYMSPEQSRGQAMDGRSDLYSLGIVFYEMLVGAVPFQGKDAVAIAIKHLTAEIPGLPPHYAVYQQLVNRLLAKESANRFQSGAELVTAIDIIEETLAGVPGRRTLGTDPAELNPGILFKALLLTSFAALQFKIRQLYAALTGKTAAERNSINTTDDWLDQVDTLEDKRPTILSDRVSDALQHGAETSRRSVRRSLLLMTLLLAILGAVSLGGAHPGQLFPSSLQQLAQPGSWFTGKPASVPTLDHESLVHGSSDEPKAPEVQSVPESAPLASLTVDPQPTDARVRILNIRERYHPGIELEQGRYHIEVSKSGYTRVRKWVELQAEDLVLQYTLSPLRNSGDVFADDLQIGGKGPDMVVIPSGQFLMGQDDDASASPQRPVSIAKNFAISKYEITFALFDLYAQSTGEAMPDDRRWGRGEQPAINVSWHDAMSFARWLSKQTGQHYRLATEAEWEYVARAGSDAGYWWGEEEPADRANCRRGCNSSYTGLFSSKTAPVGSFPANPFGVHDTAGNVAEWVLDCYEDGYLNATLDGRATVNDRCELRSLRGGSASDDHRALYSFARQSAKPEQSSSMIGFRLVREFVY